MVPSSSLKKKVFKSTHGSPLAGHPGLFKKYRMMREIISWKGLKSDVMKYVNFFPMYQQNKVEHTYPIGLLHPFPIPKQKWERISMDFIIGLPNVPGKDWIFVVVGICNKFSHFFVINTSFTASQVVELLFR